MTLKNRYNSGIGEDNKKGGRARRGFPPFRPINQLRLVVIFRSGIQYQQQRLSG